MNIRNVFQKRVVMPITDQRGSQKSKRELDPNEKEKTREQVKSSRATVRRVLDRQV